MNRLTGVGVLSLVLLGAAGCVGRSGSGTSEPPPEEVFVNPEQFDPSVPCREGQLQRYVATLLDVSPVVLAADAGPLALPSAPPVSCHNGVGFGGVLIGNSYIAEIDGYDRVDISPKEPGQREMVDAEGDPVTPRWTATCGVSAPGVPVTDAGVPLDPFRDGSADFTEPAPTGGPAVVLENVTVPLIGCTAFVQTGS